MGTTSSTRSSPRCSREGAEREQRGSRKGEGTGAERERAREAVGFVWQGTGLASCTWCRVCCRSAACSCSTMRTWRPSRRGTGGRRRGKERPREAAREEGAPPLFGGGKFPGDEPAVHPPPPRPGLEGRRGAAAQPLRRFCQGRAGPPGLDPLQTLRRGAGAGRAAQGRCRDGRLMDGADGGRTELAARLSHGGLVGASRWGRVACVGLCGPACPASHGGSYGRLRQCRPDLQDRVGRGRRGVRPATGILL